MRILVYGEGTETFEVNCASIDPSWVKDVSGVKLSRAVTFTGTFTGFGNMTARFENCRLVPQ